MLTDFTLRLIAALLLGGAIGLEREMRSKDAGFRTHVLVALGSALFTLVSQYGFGSEARDVSRVAAQVVSGIGFLGAGTIIFQKNVVRGITTAAGLWVTAAIGMACGTGLYAMAGITTALVLVGLESISVVLPRLGTISVQLSFTASDRQSVRDVLARLKAGGVEIVTREMKRGGAPHGSQLAVTMDVKMKRDGHSAKIADCLAEFDDVIVSNME